MQYFPAMQGSMGGRRFFNVMVPVKEIGRIFETYVNQKTRRAEAKAGINLKEDVQRSLDLKRIPPIINYLANNLEGWVFSSIVASFAAEKDEYDFEPLTEFQFKNGVTMGKLVFHDFERFLINDGQHRCSALKLAMDSHPLVKEAIGNEHISIILFPTESIARQKQVFHDLNSYGKVVSGSLNTAVGNSPLDIITQVIVTELDIFDGKTELEKASPQRNSDKVFSLGALRKANENLLGNRFAKSDEQIQAAQARALEFWSTLAEVLPSWAELVDGTLEPDEMRTKFVCAHAVFLRAMGSVGKRIYQLPERDRAACYEILSERRQWLRGNQVWKGKIFDDNERVINNKSAEASLYKYLINKLKIGEEV